MDSHTVIILYDENGANSRLNDEFNFHVGDALSWAKKNCPSFITVDGWVKGDEIGYQFYFVNGQDATMFALKWQ